MGERGTFPTSCGFLRVDGTHQKHWYSPDRDRGIREDPQGGLDPSW